jgi:hypothetical protein
MWAIISIFKFTQPLIFYDMYNYICTEVHPPVILTYNLGIDATAYSGQRVTFRCTVKIVVDLGIVITWRSEDYIGRRGDALQITSDDPAGTTVNKLTTVVMLISSTRSSDGLTTVITELQLTADAMYANSHVSCMANGRFVSGITFLTSGNARTLILCYIFFVHS